MNHLTVSKIAPLDLGPHGIRFFLGGGGGKHVMAAVAGGHPFCL